MLSCVIQADIGNTDPIIQVIKLVRHMGKDMIQLKKQVESSTIRLLLTELRMKKSQMQVRNLTRDMGAIKLEIKTDEKQSSKIHRDLQGDMVGVKEELSAHMETISEIEQVQDIFKNSLINFSEKLHINEEVVKSVNKNVWRLQEDVTALAGKITALEEEVDTNKDDISTVKDVQEVHAERLLHLQQNVDTNKNEIAKIYKDFKDLFGVKGKLDELSDFINQIHLYMQYESPRYKNKLHYSFSQVVKLTGKEDKISKDAPILRHLLEQTIEFEEKYKYKWDIKYSEVVRLSEGLVFNDSRPLLILNKIDYMYEQFNKLYRKEWGIEFKDVVYLTENLDFNVGDEVPVLRKISNWYIDGGFQEIWGDSFKEFFAIMKDNPAERTTILEKLSDVAHKDKFLRFLKARFVYEREELSVYGYIEVFLENIWGTIWNRNNFSNGPARVLCRQAGYEERSGRYDDGKYNTGTVHHNLTCLVPKLQCIGYERNVEECARIVINDTISWDHKEDLGIKCTFKSV